MLPNGTFFSGLERIPDLNAIPSDWSSVMGREFELAKGRYFRKQPEPASSYFCERCNCAHEVVSRSPGLPAPEGAAAILSAHPPPALLSSAPQPLVAVCGCDGAGCPDILLAPHDIEIWELDWPSLGRSLCEALCLDPQEDEFPFYNTLYVGSWPENALPVFLSIQTEPGDLRAAINELGVRHPDPFILLVPTAAHLKFASRELLCHRKAQVLPLDQNVVLGADGNLRAARSPDELLAQSNPEPEPDTKNIAIAALAIVQCLEAIKTKGPPTILEAFKRRYLDRRSKAQIAEEFDCHVATVRNRLRAIKRALGDKYQGLERYVPLFREVIAQRSHKKAVRVAG